MAQYKRYVAVRHCWGFCEAKVTSLFTSSSRETYFIGHSPAVNTPLVFYFRQHGESGIVVNARLRPCPRKSPNDSRGQLENWEVQGKRSNRPFQRPGRPASHPMIYVHYVPSQNSNSTEPDGWINLPYFSGAQPTITIVGQLMSPPRVPGRAGSDGR